MNLKKTAAIAMLTIEENVRKKVLYILLFISLLLIVFSSSVTSFGLGGQATVMKDLSLSGIQFFGLLFTLSLFLNVIPREIETKTIYPFIAQPITRGDYLWGKFLGLFAVIAVNLLVLGAVMMLCTYPYEHFWNFDILKAVVLIILQCGVIGALMLMFSLITSYPLALSLTLFLYILGSASSPYLAYIAKGLPVLFTRFLIVLKLILPKLDMFVIKNAVVHNHALLPGYFTSSILYGAAYILLLMLLSLTLFESKDL